MGSEKLNQEFDISNLIMKQRASVLLQQIFLSTQQKALLPFFKNNLLYIKTKKVEKIKGNRVNYDLSDPMNKRYKKKIKGDLRGIIDNAEKSKTD